MNPNWHEQIQRYLADQSTADEAAALQQALSHDEELRDLYLDYLNLDLTLAARANSASVEQAIVPFEQRPAAPLSVWAKFSLAALPLGAAAAVALMFLPAGKSEDVPEGQNPAGLAQLILQNQLPPAP